ncbi:MAG TPA: hypothetical protein VGR06_28035 [Actinophytocola sp.]|uniref:hypothetical protein n=1 Tax=Actinophytocola sp. TaxID=1872138 RepID=UPI002E0D00B7|nr:hypothetical protein [Actinophytocola sp.]
MPHSHGAPRGVEQRPAAASGVADRFDQALALIPPLSSSGSGSLGPFTAGYSANATFSGGDADLIPPGTIRITDFRVDWSILLSFQFNLSDILPDFCIPRVCIHIPCVGTVCTPKICIDWPTITIPVSFADFVQATADFGLAVTQVGGVWKVDAVIQGLPNLKFGAATAAMLAAIGLAATPILLAIPFIGPFLALAVNGILALIGLAGVTGLLGPILTPFVSGLKIPVFSQPATFAVLPPAGPFDPAVTIHLDAVSAGVSGTDEDELLVSVDVSP